MNPLSNGMGGYAIDAHQCQRQSQQTEESDARGGQETENMS